MEPFLAYRIHKDDGKIGGRVEHVTLDDLNEGGVVIRAAWSGINYKDALAATGAGRIVRRFPMVGGIDVAGVVHASNDPPVRGGRSGGDHRLRPERGLRRRLLRVRARVGGLADSAARRNVAAGQHGDRHRGLHRRRPRRRSGWSSTASVPDRGPVLVNGRDAGGVGSFAIDMLGGLGYEVTAFTGKRDQDEYLRALGASNILIATRWRWERARWRRRSGRARVDNVGGDQLAWLTRTVRPEANIASIGLAGGFKLETTVMAVHPARCEPPPASTASTSGGSSANGYGNVWHPI